MQLKFACGKQENLSQYPIKNGQIIFTIDTRKIFFDYNDQRIEMCHNEKEEIDNYGEDPIYKIEKQDNLGSQTSTDSRFGYNFGDIDLPPLDYEGWIHWLRS